MDLQKIAKTMKELITKFIHTSSAVFIVCIAVYSMVYAQQVCCSDIATTCISTSSRISVRYSIGNVCRPSSSHHYSSQLIDRSHINDLGAEETCCETDDCETYGQATYINPSLLYDDYPLQKAVCSLDTGNNAPITYESYDLLISLKSVPISILTKSILC